MHKSLLFVIIGTLALASCGQQPLTTDPAAKAPETQPVITEGSVSERIAAYAQRPELSEESKAYLREHANDPLVLDSLDRAYGVVTTPFDEEALARQVTLEQGAQVPSMTDQASGKAGYAQSVAWGSVNNYWYQRAHPKYSGLNWGHNGCSAPKGVGLGYRSTFLNPCIVHDFGYGNLPKLTARWAWLYNKARTDSAFLSNMRGVCNKLALHRRPDCYLAASAYYQAVDKFGIKAWVDNS